MDGLVVLSVIGLIGLIIFVVGGLVHLFSPKTTLGGTFGIWSLAVVGLLIWAIAQVIILLITLF